ncbi:unnamed protein product [Auanema sp. JU1783]|nr:unnamed protein product [Auanema sp. JU1783]
MLKTASTSSTPGFPKHFSDVADSKNTQNNGQSRQEKAKVRRAYALGGCLLFIWLSTHGILLYRRRNEYRNLNEKLPAIPFADFMDNYLSKGLVKTVVFQPQFNVANVYLFSNEEQQMKNVVVSMFRAAPDKFSRPPDVRFIFEGDDKQLENVISNVQKEAMEAGVELSSVEYSVDQFPSYRELSFIIASTLFTLAAVTLMK